MRQCNEILFEKPYNFIFYWPKSIYAHETCPFYIFRVCIFLNPVLITGLMRTMRSMQERMYTYALLFETQLYQNCVMSACAEDFGHLDNDYDLGSFVVFHFNIVKTALVK